MFDRTRFQQGQDVYDVNGQKIGSVGNVTQDYLDVSAGVLGFDHLHIPFSEISRMEGNRLYLSVPKNEIGNRNWQGPAAAATSGMYGTMPAMTQEPAVYGRGAGTALSGYDLFTSDNHKMGTVLDESPNYVHLQTGLLGLGQDLYIPKDCINRCDGANHRCYLSYSRDQVGHQHWNRRPAEGETFTCGVGGQTTPPPSTTRPVSQAVPPPRAEYTRSETEVERLPLVEESITPEIERQRLGEVDVTKRVEEQHVSYNVPVSHDEVTIRETPVDHPTNVAPNEQGDIRVPIYGETVDVEKGSRVYGEIEVEKRRVTEQQRVEGTIRREVPEVHREGNVDEDVEVEGNLEKRDDQNPPRKMSR